MAEALTLKTLVIAFLGGILPALVWLFFWLREDRRRPEPRGLITLSFLVGILAVIVTFPIQKLFYSYILGGPDISLPSSSLWIVNTPVVIWGFAAIEELIKFGGAYLIALRTKYFDEPVDAMIYLITVALGFSAMENSLYLLNLLLDGDVIGAAINANLRFLGATLLHTIASASVGIAIAFSHYKGQRFLYLPIGILTAIALHAVFNLLIIEATTTKEILTVFSYFWVAIVVLILIFEKVKRLVCNL